MLELKNIKKDYPAGDGMVHAIKGLSLSFRESEFVSILGPSGCGKTSLLNIIGGLDSCTDGDLVINGVSTREYKDRDWDAYRNHTIGFVFQSYNLIPHQSVLQNVELALTLSGVSKAERRKRAVKALQDVGLGDQLQKKPSQMSGGQMQRVAIARALVNDPEIILADEPTGALDTETSVQVMDILQEVARDRLVIMVTHNPELAQKYSTRIIRMLDGELLDDSHPMTLKEKRNAKNKDERAAKRKMPSMKFRTAFGLSLKNLINKRSRTALTAFAGSIGIIGIALIYAVSQGMTAYIDTLQEDTLSSYPLTLEQQNLDMGGLLETFVGSAVSGGDHEADAVYQKAMIYELVNALNTMEDTENDLASYKRYLEEELASEGSALQEAVSGVQYSYSAPLLVYTQNVDGSIIQSDTEALMQELLIEYFGMDLSSMMDLGADYGVSMDSMSSFSPMASSVVLWQELLPGTEGEMINPLLEKQYDLVYGSWPTEYNEIVLVLDENNELDDMTLYALGLKSRESIDALAKAAFDQTVVEVQEESWSYKEICDMEFRVILSSDCYALDEATGCYHDLRDTQAGLRYLYDNATVLKVSGILRPNEEAVAGMISGTIGYTSELTQFIMAEAEEAASVQAQLADPSTDIFTGLPFVASTGDRSQAEKAQEFDEYIAQLDESEKAAAYQSMLSVPSEEMVADTVGQTMQAMSREDMEQSVRQAIGLQMGVAEDDVADYVAAMSDEDLESVFSQIVEEQFRQEYAAAVQAELAAVEPVQQAALLDEMTAALSQEEKALYHDEVLQFSDSSYEENLLLLGFVDPEAPSAINIYASTFENKDVIEQSIQDYNAGVEELSQIHYTDYVGLMMSSVTSIINAITYVLIAFVAISLIVSSIMIAVITLISVQERTKEIGILRAVGASKKNVASMFNAETIIIGFLSGALGVGLTYILCVPINALIYKFTGIAALRAFLPWQVALILLAVSMLLTLLAGFIPSRSAAKKDPVVALRSE